MKDASRGDRQALPYQGGASAAPNPLSLPPASNPALPFPREALSLSPEGPRVSPNPPRVNPWEPLEIIPGMAFILTELPPEKKEQDQGGPKAGLGKP